MSSPNGGSATILKISDKLPSLHSLTAKFTTLRSKMLLAYLGIVVLILLILNYYPLLVVRDLIITSNQDAILSDCNFISSQVSSVTQQQQSEMMDKLVANMNLSQQYDRVLVTAQTGIVTYDSKQTGNIVGKRALFSEIFTALGGKENFIGTYDSDRFVYSAAVPVLTDDEITGCVYLHRSSYDEARLLVSSQRQILMFTLVLCVLVMGLSFFFSLILSEQIKFLGRGVQQMKEGDYESKIPVNTNDELGELATAFNDLTTKLHDTDEKRKQFVSDASHELKTPLASIKLLVDSITSTPDMPPDLLNEFLGDISHEIDRLVRTTEHLFILTRMDSDLVAPPEPIDVKTEVESALRMVTPIANARHISLTFALEDDCFILGSREGLSHIIYNLIDNAIKYNADYGYVTVRLFCRNHLVYFVVKDNGVGITPEDQAKIFNRFYRVDKARSRETGGTGLGLSIVQSNVHQLGGEIRVESELGKGSKFIVTLPQYIDPALERK